MEKPLTLRILSMATAVVGCLRVYAGVSTLSKNWDYLSQTGQMTYIIIENFFIGLLIILSGIFLFYGKSAGRLMLILGIFISLVINYINFGRIADVALLTFITILYFVIPDIQRYFSKK